MFARISTYQADPTKLNELATKLKGLKAEISAIPGGQWALQEDLDQSAFLRCGELGRTARRGDAVPAPLWLGTPGTSGTPNWQTH